VLGRHRDDDRRTGWISGLADGLGELHPTCGGLRMGKPLPERRPDQPVDDSLEWDRDGQYFHYLTKWMHALDQVTRATGQPMFSEWARELAHSAHRAFTYRPTMPGARGTGDNVVSRIPARRNCSNPLTGRARRTPSCRVPRGAARPARPVSWTSREPPLAVM
jgi:hypothetical protein